jgi:hypothetical protein
MEQLATPVNLGARVCKCGYPCHRSMMKENKHAGSKQKEK